VPRARVEVINGDTARVRTAPSRAHRGHLLRRRGRDAAVQALKHEVQGMAAELLDRAPASLELQFDHFTAPDGATISLVEIAAEFDRIGKSRRVRGYFDLTDHFPAETKPSTCRSLSPVRTWRGGGGPADRADARPPYGRCA